MEDEILFGDALEGDALFVNEFRDEPNSYFVLGICSASECASVEFALTPEQAAQLGALLQQWAKDHR